MDLSRIVEESQLRHSGQLVDAREKQLAEAYQAREAALRRELAQMQQDNEAKTLYIKQADQEILNLKNQSDMFKSERDSAEQEVSSLRNQVRANQAVTACTGLSSSAVGAIKTLPAQVKMMQIRAPVAGAGCSLDRLAERPISTNDLTSGGFPSHTPVMQQVQTPTSPTTQPQIIRPVFQKDDEDEELA